MTQPQYSLFQSNDELLGVLAAAVLLKVLLDADQVGIGIVAQLKLPVDAHHALLVVKVGKYKWHLGIAGHEDGALVPVGVGAAGTLGRYADSEPGRGIIGLDDGLREVAMLATIDRNAA